MEIAELPLHQKTTIVAEKFLIAIIERISINSAVETYINLETRKEVLKILKKSDGSQILQDVDPGYWKIFSDGTHITDFDISLFEDLSITVDISTRNRALELVTFKNADFS